MERENFPHLGCMDIDYTIRKDEPILTDTSIPAELALHELWEWSNRLSVMFIKTKISTGICGYVDQHNDVRADEQFDTSDKALASTLIIKFLSLRITSITGVCEHIMKMRDIAAQLKNLDVDMSKTFLVHYILNTLPERVQTFQNLL